MTVKIITYGGIVTEIDTPDRKGKIANVALGFDNLADYVAKSPYFGAIIGRYANRIANGTFTLAGDDVHAREQQRPQRPARRHQGLRQGGLGASGRAGFEGSRRPQAQLHEPERRRGLSGHAQVDVTYTLTSKNELSIDYHATTDKATVDQPHATTRTSTSRARDPAMSSTRCCG